MDNMISGVLSVIVFAAFTLGLAQSIGAVPFIVIVAVVLAMVLYDLRASVKDGFADERAAKARRKG